ncbi:pyridoxal phosphate-dependent aminotransferase [Mesorhizobium australafricanum]|uniref:Aminotransferase n=1 Tax=Mesorhizobium australafricanum TaxID=3072311 RepID=A0ABU4X4G3_9HYPH|nr:pyridoxal phosphate-dependent aminotransferase [Mesorhizobium sp. VK3E]MDX8443202.1 pyridoxal phosphate-dependent aminotransferase [Mesorhizobium sp. VK3E]
MSLVSSRLKSIRPSATKAMTARAAALKAQGHQVITLSQGEPDFDTPLNIVEAGIQAIRDGRTRYTAVAGVAPLREAIRDKLARENGLNYSIDQITVGCGAKQLVFNALFASLEPGDEVIIPAPCWVSYPDMVRLAGGEPVTVNCPEADGFKLSPEGLEKAITSRTKWLMLNSPSNPTGAVYSEAELAALADVLRRHPHVYILSDDIYEKLVYGAARFATMASAAPDLFDRTITINGVSKTNAMTGWRVGYGAGPIELIKAINVIQGQTTSHTSSISQYAAIEAIAGDQSYVPEFRAEFEKRRNLVVERFNSAPGLSCTVPDGAFYVFANCTGVLGQTTEPGRVIATDTDFAMYLLDEAGVAVVPGSGFLASPYIRISYASSIEDLITACDRITAACAKLTQDKAA